MRPTTSFTTRKLNSSTFVVQEQDAYVQYPLIYVKIHTKVPVIVLSDTGCDEPNDEHSGGKLSLLLVPGISRAAHPTSRAFVDSSKRH